MLKKNRSLIIILTAVYILFLTWVILFKMASISELAYLPAERRINFIPFYYDEEASFHLSEVIENVVIFIPLGLYLRMMKIKGGYAILIGAGLSLMLEAAQYIFGIGAADITDLITNTAGTAIGVAAYALLSSIFKNEKKLDRVLSIAAIVCTALIVGLTALLLFANS